LRLARTAAVAEPSRGSWFGVETLGPRIARMQSNDRRLGRHWLLHYAIDATRKAVDGE
jgi:hypothetical protein